MAAGWAEAGRARLLLRDGGFGLPPLPLLGCGQRSAQAPPGAEPKALEWLCLLVGGLVGIEEQGGVLSKAGGETPCVHIHPVRRERKETAEG